MLKLILERIIVFGLIFALGFAFSSNAGKKYQNLEQNFKNDITQVMDKYNYIEADKSIWDYRFVNGNNEITYEVTINPQQVKVKEIHQKINFTDLVELTQNYELLREIYTDDTVNYAIETEKLYTEFLNTKEEQRFHEYDNKREISIAIENSTDIENTYELNYQIRFF